VFADTALFEYGDARWVGTESGRVDYENWNVIDRHGYLRWRPIEADTPLREVHWFWHPHDEASLKSLEDLTGVYEHTVGRGAQLMLGLAPDTRGLLPDSDVARLKEFGIAIQRLHSGNAALQHLPTTPEAAAALDGNVDTFWSAPAGSHHSVLEVELAKPTSIDRVTTMEWLNDGQHVEKYAIEVWNGKAWKSVASGEAIGHEKVDRFPPVTASRIRLNILSSSQEAHIREFQVYGDVPTG
jgi:alpha-L-fucosidase